jgi:hypothetical protein
LHLALLLFWSQVSTASCGDVAECRRLATEAATRGDAEAFHDLAWRAVQKGKPNDPALMLLLARAQSLSGRPGDALVMLTRVADLGVIPDVSSDPDFARVRALRGWPELEAKLAGKTPAAAPSAPTPAAASAPAPSAPSPAAPAAPAAASPPASKAPSDSLPFSAPGVQPFALAHDAVSRRFVLGDRQAHRLLIVDEVSHNVVNYVGSASAGFLDRLTGFTIDPRRGDLWVVSAAGEDAAAVSALHKLQLVSGRSLFEARAPERAGPVRFTAVTVASDGTVYVLDAEGSRLFRLPPGGRALEQVMRVNASGLASLTSASDRILYVAAASGLLRVDLTARTAVRVTSAEDLTGLASLDWKSGALIAIEPVDGGSRVVRLKMDPTGTRARPREILASSPTSAVGTIVGDAFYYLSAETILRLSLR